MDQAQSWVALVGALLATVLGILKYFNYKSRRDRIASVGLAFGSIVDGLSSESEAKKLAAAILLRRFFDGRTEQGEAGTPYGQEAIAVIAALLRGTPPGELQKLLADGLGYAPSLHRADLQGCNLSRAYLGQRELAPKPAHRVRVGFLAREGPPSESESSGALGGQESFMAPVNMSAADLFEADLSGASLRGAHAQEAVFYGASLHGTVLEHAHLQGGDFRGADLNGARLTGALLSGARFEDAKNIPSNVERLLDERRMVPHEYTQPVAPP
jgi:Pentapeptide repeats (8 copies)